MKKMIKFYMLLFLCLICFSCAGKQQPDMSYVDVDGDKELMNKIVVEIADLIHQEKNINTTINLVYDFSDTFGNLLFEELKGRGFALSDVDGVVTTYTVNSFEPNRIYLSITLDKMRLSRIFVYEAQTGTIKSFSPLSRGEV
jgi:hypothetical protein